MMTCVVLIGNPDGITMEARALLDSASTASLISERMTQAPKPFVSVALATAPQSLALLDYPKIPNAVSDQFQHNYYQSEPLLRRSVLLPWLYLE